MGEKERSLLYKLAQVEPDKLPLFPSRAQVFGIDSAISGGEEKNPRYIN